MKKLPSKSTPLHILRDQLTEVKGGDAPINPNPAAPPLDDPNARANIIDVG